MAQINNANLNNNQNRIEMINSYLQRDNEMNLDSNQNRLKKLKKLGYTLEQINKYQSDKQKEFVMNYVRNRYENYIENNFEIGYMNFNNIISDYENSQEYQRVLDIVNNRMDRFNVLSQYIGGTNYDFYNALSYEELIYLGW